LTPGNELGFQLLVHLHNLLAHRRRRVFTLVNGQLELDARRKTFLDTGKLEIVGRFFPRTWQFHGLSLSDLETVLSALDSPDDKGLSVTSRLAPRASEKGWRLSPAASTTVKAIRDIAQKSKIAGEPMVPMQNLVSFVLVLASKAEAGEGLDGFAPSAIVDALNRCGYVDIMALHARPQ
jgi:hypothetical protein